MLRPGIETPLLVLEILKSMAFIPQEGMHLRQKLNFILEIKILKYVQNTVGTVLLKQACLIMFVSERDRRVFSFLYLIKGRVHWDISLQDLSQYWTFQIPFYPNFLISMSFPPFLIGKSCLLPDPPITCSPLYVTDQACAVSPNFINSSCLQTIATKTLFDGNVLVEWKGMCALLHSNL